MKLSAIAKKPTLVKQLLDDEDIVKEFGEPLEYYTYDRQPMEVFMRLTSVDPNNQGQVIDNVKDLILDENAKPVINKDSVLPTWVLMRVMTRVVDSLGK